MECVLIWSNISNQVNFFFLAMIWSETFHKGYTYAKIKKKNETA